MRFDDFQSHLGIARNILTARLERLTALGVLERFPLPDRANTDGYRLTKKGEDLYPVLVALMQWGDRWLTKSGMHPTELVEDTTGKPVQAVTVTSKAGRPLSYRDVRVVCGPGATIETRQAVQRRNESILGR